MKKLLLLITLFTFIACNREVITTEEPKDAIEIIKFGYKITQEDALKIAENAPNLFTNDVLTKATKRRVLEGIPVTTNSQIKTKSGYQQIDTLMYLFNYADSMGYVFVSTDERTGDIIAFIEKGNFNIQDTAKNKLSNFLVSLMLNYQQTNLEEFKEIENTTKGDVGPIGPSDKTYGAYLRNGQGPMCNKVLKSDCNYGVPVDAPYEAQVQGDYYYKNKGCIATREFREPDINIGPLLTTQWDQTSPFNNNAPIINGEHAYAGCTAIATSQVMTYHSYPTNYPSDIHNGAPTYIASLRKVKKGTDFTSSASKNTVATFVRTIGDLLKNSWGVYPDGTGGSQYNVPGCFAKMGYTNPSRVIPYDYRTLMGSLYRGLPVIIIGWTSTNSSREGHTWVIDGCKEFNSGYDNYYFDEYGRFNGSKFGAYRDNENVSYLNCNYGWDGSYDGYYTSGMFNTGNGNLNYLLEIIPNIKK